MLEDTDEAKAERKAARAAAEAVHGVEHMAEMEETYKALRRRLQDHKIDSGEKQRLLKETRALELEYGYEVITGAPRVTRGDDPVHNWGRTDPDRQD